MTKTEAIHILDNLKPTNTKSSFDAYDVGNALTMAIKALEQEPCEDVVSRQELLKAISTWDKFGCDADTKLVPYKDHYVPYIHYDDVINCIKGMPPVTPQPKMGKWIYNKKEDSYRCNLCHCPCHKNNLGAIPTEYCAGCGAVMEVWNDD